MEKVNPSRRAQESLWTFKPATYVHPGDDDDELTKEVIVGMSDSSVTVRGSDVLVVGRRYVCIEGIDERRLMTFFQLKKGGTILLDGPFSDESLSIFMSSAPISIIEHNGGNNG